MNSKVKWTQLIGVAVLATLASVFVTGLVAAVPGIPLQVNRFADDAPPAITNESSWARFEQYMAASMPEDYDASANIPASSFDSWARFEQYMAASSPQEYGSTSAIDDSWARFELYLEHSQ